MGHTIHCWYLVLFVFVVTWIPQWVSCSAFFCIDRRSTDFPWRVAWFYTLFYWG